MRAKLHAGHLVLMRPAVGEGNIEYETDIHCRLCERKLKE